MQCVMLIPSSLRRALLSFVHSIVFFQLISRRSASQSLSATRFALSPPTRLWCWRGILHFSFLCQSRWEISAKSHVTSSVSMRQGVVAKLGSRLRSRSYTGSYLPSPFSLHTDQALTLHRLSPIISCQGSRGARRELWPHISDHLLFHFFMRWIVYAISPSHSCLGI